MEIERIDGVLKYYEMTTDALQKTLEKSKELNNSKMKNASEVALQIFTDTVELIKIAKEFIIQNNLNGDKTSE